MHAAHCPGSNFFGEIVAKKIRASLGGSVRMIVSGAAKVNEDALRFFAGAGIPLGSYSYTQPFGGHGLIFLSFFLFFKSTVPSEMYRGSLLANGFGILICMFC